MTVSLVKSYFTAGWSMPGCLPESDPALFTTLDEARAYLADELDRAADETAQSATDEFEDEASAFIAASAEFVRGDRDGDIAWAVSHHRAGWSTSESDGYCYWVESAQL